MSREVIQEWLLGKDLEVDDHGIGYFKVVSRNSPVETEVGQKNFCQDSGVSPV
jgi:hypothetical protein